MDEQFYDIIDSEGNVIETKEQQGRESQNKEKSISLVTHEPIKMTKEMIKQQMKKWRRQHITVINPTANPCGHKLDMGKQPTHTNCEFCWFLWFQNHGPIVQQCDEMLKAEHGKELIIELQGIKFLKRFLQFMSTLASWQKSAEIAKQQDTQHEQVS